MDFPNKIDACAQTVLKSELTCSESRSEDLGHVTVRHNEIFTNDETGSTVRIIGIARQLEPSNRHDGFTQVVANGLILVQHLP